MWSRVQLFMPQRTAPTINGIDFSSLKSLGIKVILFDKDNCITAPHRPNVHATVLDQWNRCIDIFGRENIYIVSNSAGSKDDPSSTDAEAFEQLHNVHVLRHGGKKPFGGDDVMRMLRLKKPELQPSQVCMVGDRLMTDVLFGNLNGMSTIWLTRHLEQGLFDVSRYV
ncbi:hypothetical protein MP638_000844, partial [Amoeboaphelidium occidentale]